MATRIGRFLALLVGGLLLVGCGESVAASREVSLHVSGGIAGVQRGIEVGPGGSVILVDGKGRHAGRDLSGAEREKLGSLLDAVDFAALPSRSVDEGSRDRFEYRLAHDGRTVITDRSTDLGPADDLIDHLESCMDARRAGAVQGTPTHS
ncbi:hypothetical protein [Streptomyces violens]|uniref:hypothetical protein n=1 Tax=Streptomyces violens TaxID=66377 RepID=UPI00068AD0FE|nr:hypothetical protein [Streptomyces violens]